jgi:hypothetical protein
LAMVDSGMGVMSKVWFQTWSLIKAKKHCLEKLLLFRRCVLVLSCSFHLLIVTHLCGVMFAAHAAFRDRMLKPRWRWRCVLWWSQLGKILERHWFLFSVNIKKNSVFLRFLVILDYVLTSFCL